MDTHVSGAPIADLNMTFPKQRPTRWSITQLEKLFDQFYDEDFVKNTHQMLLGNAKKLNRYLQGSNESFFVSSFQTWLRKKFNKNVKTVEYNLTNVLYSIAFYLEEF